MKKWLALTFAILVLIGGYVAAGPFLSIHSIREAIKQQDAAALSEHVDFPALRASFRQQLEDYLIRSAGPEAQSSILGTLALRITSGASGGMVDVMATPAGLAAIMQGRSFWHRLKGERSNADPYQPAPPRDPLEGAHYAFESPWRFTATVLNGDGEPVVVVLTRQGLQWKVTDIRLPL